MARVEAPDLSFTAISAYGLMEFGYASGTLLRTIADLEPLLDDPTLGDNVVLAGDWNIGTWWKGEEDAKYAAPGERCAATARGLRLGRLPGPPLTCRSRPPTRLSVRAR